MMGLDEEEVMEEIRRTAQATAEEYIQNSTELPNIKDYDWTPFLAALAVHGKQIDPVPPEERPTSDYFDEPAPKDNGIVPPEKQPVKDPKTGSWTWVYYAPPWTHPNYSDNITVEYDGTRHLRGTLDPITKIRPAVLASDALRNPTPYALRFGIHPEETGGRSHLSPTVTNTRNPLEDYTNQVSLLSDFHRSQAIAETRRRGLSNPTDPDWIDPAVLEEAYANANVLAGSALKTAIAAELERQPDLSSLDEITDRLRNEHPSVFNANKNFLEGALMDQAWQRYLFAGLSTDELIQNKIHSITGTDVNELDGPLHPWVQRSRWEDTVWKGADEGYPRFLYTINGERKEYDVHTNDELWEALQPALQLVSRVLYSNHPFYQALKDLRTRQLIPEELDPRDPDDEERPIETPYLSRYVPVDQINLYHSFEGVVELANMAYDWEANVNRLMDQYLVLDIGSCYWDWVDLQVGSNLTYGWTVRYGAGAEGTRYHVSIGAETLWPLLSPDISPSEKLVTSFLVATVILHEFAHACQQALESLTTQEWAHPPEQDPLITKAALSLGPDLWDHNVWNGESPFQSNSVAEVGNDAEQELWGYMVGSLVGENAIKPTRELQSNPLIIKGTHWPGTNSTFDNYRLQGPYTLEDYGRPFPMDYIARLFKKEFWETSFLRYGHEALKQLPLSRIHKFVRTSNWLPHRPRQQFFGKEEASFLRAVMRHLGNNGYPLLSNYLRESQREVIERKVLASKWGVELQNWSNVFCDVDSAVARLMASMGEGAIQNSIRTSSASDQGQEYSYYVDDYNLRVDSGLTFGGPVDFDTWRYNLEQQWVEAYKLGGIITKDVATVNRLMMNDIGFNQRLILDYLSLDPDVRKTIYRGGGADDPTIIGTVWGRIVEFLNNALTISNFLQNIGNIEQLANLKPHYELWSTRFRGIANMYKQLVDILGGQDEYDPNDWKWKARLPTIPSSAWRKEMDNLKLLAAHQYQRVDPRIRNTLDIAAGIIDSASGNTMFPDAADENIVQELIKGLKVQNQNRINDGFKFQQSSVAVNYGGASGAPPPLQKSSPGKPNALWDAIAAAQQSGGYGSGVVRVDPAATAAVAPAVIPGSNTGITFGQASMLPRLTTQPPAQPPQTIGRMPGPGEIPRRASRTSPDPLGIAQGRIERRGSVQAGPGFRNYGSWARARRFDSIGGQQRISWGDGSAIQSEGQTMFPSTAQTGPRGRPDYRPFMHPYAGPTTVSADIQNYQAERAVEHDIQTMLYDISPYKSSEPYREMGIETDLDAPTP